MSTQERRRLFIAAMRRPEMRLLRLALRYLRDGKGMDWREIREMMTDHYRPDCWMMQTERFQVVSVWVHAAMTYEDFFFEWVHDPSNPFCECDMCRDERVCWIALKDLYMQFA